MIMYASAGNRTRDPLLCSSNHSAMGRDIDMLLELLQYFLIKRYYKNYVSCACSFIFIFYISFAQDT